MFIPAYVFATPFLGGQAAVSLLGFYGRNDTTLAGTFTGTVTVGGITTPPFTLSRNFDSTLWGFGDLEPMATVKWNKGNDNWMVYITGDIPVGAYSSTRLANLGIGHGAIDGGIGYTYFNQQTGHEFSAVLGLTGNFQNTSTNYTNGVDLHLDWGASQFLTKQTQVGLVGYVYKEIGCDSGSGDRVGCFQSQVIGIGPQIGRARHPWRARCAWAAPARSPALLRGPVARSLRARPRGCDAAHAGTEHLHGTCRRCRHLLVSRGDAGPAERHRRRGRAGIRGRCRMTPLAPHLTAFLRDHLPRERGASPHTIASYADSFVLLLRFAAARVKREPADLQVEDLDVALVRAFLNHLESDRGNGARSRACTIFGTASPSIA
jgi:hypothetical protein